MPTWGTQVQLADMMGVKKSTVSDWKRQGKLKGLIRKGKVNLDKAAEVIPGRIAPKQQRSANIKHGKVAQPPKPTDIENPETEEAVKSYLDETIGDLAQLDIYELQKRNELEKLLMARIKRNREEGELVPLDQVKNECFSAFRLMRDAILNIPDRESASLMSLKTEKQFKAKLTEALRQPLGDLQKFKYAK